MSSSEGKSLSSGSEATSNTVETTTTAPMTAPTTTTTTTTDTSVAKTAPGIVGSGAGGVGGGGGNNDDPVNVEAGGGSTSSSSSSSTPLIVKVCILIDATGSMGAWIEGAKTAVLEAATKIRTKFLNSTFSLSYVAYRDYSEEGNANTPRFEVIPFTSDVESLRQRILRTKAAGGGDEAEDVAGGLYHVLNLDWNDAQHGVKVVIHCADAAAHGRKYHPISIGDEYPKGATEVGRDPSDQISKLASRRIDYTFMKLNPHTDMMIDEFAKAHERGARTPTGAGDDANFVVLDVAPQLSSSSSVAAVPCAMPAMMDGVSFRSARGGSRGASRITFRTESLRLSAPSAMSKKGKELHAAVAESAPRRGHTTESMEALPMHFSTSSSSSSSDAPCSSASDILAEAMFSSVEKSSKSVAKRASATSSSSSSK